MMLYRISDDGGRIGFKEVKERTMQRDSCVVGFLDLRNSRTLNKINEE